MAVNNIRLRTAICMMILVASTTIQGKSTGLPPASDSTEAVTLPPTATESDPSGLNTRTSNPVVSNNLTTEEQEFNSNNTENNSSSNSNNTDNNSWLNNNNTDSNSWSNSNNTSDNSWTNSNKNNNNSWWNGNNAGNSSDVCSSRPCYNGGWCQRVWYSFWCLCPPGYWGRQCESSNPCASNPCQNWGTCSVPWYNPSMFTCACAPGYTGTTCQIKTFANWLQWSKK